MNLKESVKTKVDQLDHRDLRLVYLLIDALSGRKYSSRLKRATHQKHYEKVIQLLGNTGLSSKDINIGREERI